MIHHYIDTYLDRIDILNIVIHRCINIRTVYLYIQYFMTDAIVVYYGCQFYSSATTYLVLIILDESSTNSHLTVLYNISLCCDTKTPVC